MIAPSFPPLFTGLDANGGDPFALACATAEAGCDACRHIKRLPEYLVLQFKSDPAKRRQRPVVFPIEGLDLSG